MDGGLLIFFWIIVGALVGGVIGASRNNVGSGVVWGTLLGPIGWILVLFLDNRSKCPECRGSLPENAHRCQHCGYELGAPKPNLQRGQFSSELSKIAPVELDKKKCPFCAELIQREAIKCRFCGSDLTKTPAKPEQLPEKKSEISLADSTMAAFLEKSRIILCPLCGQRIKVSTLKRGENYCPHWFQMFMAEWP